MSFVPSAFASAFAISVLPTPAGTFDQQWLAERHRKVQGRRHRGVGDVNLFFQQPLDLSDFFSQFVSTLASRSKSSAVLMLSGKGRSK